jgi:hypothetical protein
LRLGDASAAGKRRAAGARLIVTSRLISKSPISPPVHGFPNRIHSVPAKSAEEIFIEFRSVFAI